MRFMKIAFLMLSLNLSSAAHSAQTALTASEAREIATEAYIYLYPMISMEVSRAQMTNLPSGKIPGFGPMNMFHHMRAYPDANFKAVVRPNFDTLYSSAWLDLTKGPVLVSMPDTYGRYYLLPVLDMWTDVLAAPGTRTTGTGAQVTAVIPPNWKGTLPKGVQVVQATTPYLWMIGRIQTNGAKDYDEVHKTQDAMKIHLLSEWGKAPKVRTVKVDPAIDMKTPPLDFVNGMKAEDYFAMGAKLMKTNRPHLTDWSQIERMKKIGISPDAAFDASKLTAEVRQALAQGATEGLTRMKDKVPTIAAVRNGWSMNTTTMGVYGNDYLKRAIVSMVGLGANQPEDAIYPLGLADQDGKTLVGGQKYVLRFKKEDLPPTSAFWSLTAYDSHGFQVANELNRFAIGDRDTLKFNPDGSLDLYVQHENPGAEKVSNWLPAPATGDLGLTMRIYAPKAQVLDGRWYPPAFLRQ